MKNNSVWKLAATAFCGCFWPRSSALALDRQNPLKRGIIEGNLGRIGRKTIAEDAVAVAGFEPCHPGPLRELCHSLVFELSRFETDSDKGAIWLVVEIEAKPKSKL